MPSVFLIRRRSGANAWSSTASPGIEILDERRPNDDIDDPHAQSGPFGIGQLQFLAGDELDRLLFALVDRDDPRRTRPA